MGFDLQTTVNGAITKSLEGGVIEKLVEDNVNSAVSKAFTEQFGHYSPFKKSLEKAIGEALGFDPADFDIQRYHLIIRNVVKKRIEEKMTLEFAGELDKLLEDLHRPVPAELKLSELVSAFIEHFEKDYERKRADRVSVKVETTEYGFSTIRLNPDGNRKSPYAHRDMSLYLNKEGHVYSVSIHGESIDKKFFLSSNRGFERLLVGLYMQKSRIVMDSYDSAYKEEPEDECHCD